MPYPTVTGYDVELEALADAHPGVCTRIQVNPTSGRTHEGRDVYALKVGVGSGPDRPAVLVVAGLHAREWAPPDAVLSFARKLVEAYVAQSAITLRRFVHVLTRTPFPVTIVYPQLTLPWPSVREIVERLDTYLLPMANPDGRIYSHVHPGYRKNRRPTTTTCPGRGWADDFVEWLAGLGDHDVPQGVDVNRNFRDPAPSRVNVLWAFEQYYSPAGGAGVHTSDDPCSTLQIYRGLSDGPEPETQNIQSLINQHRVRWFLDVHSAARLVLYPWGMDRNGSADATQSFTNPDWDRGGPRGGRDGIRGNAYDEYVPDDPPDRLASNQRLYTETIAEAILRCGGVGPAADPAAVSRSRYTPQQSIGLYPTTGDSTSYAFSRQFLPPAERWGPVYAFTIECGSENDGEGGFHPSVGIYPKIEREAHAGIFAFLASAANFAARGTVAPALPEVPAPSAGP